MTDEELIRSIRGGNEKNIDVLMEKYKPLVRSRANMYYLIGGETEDLIQEGMIGLFKAVRDYDPGKGSAFATFAELCISRQLYTAVESSGRKKNQPLNTAVSLSAEVNAEGELLEETLGQDLDNPEYRILEEEKLQEFTGKLSGSLSKMEKEVLFLYLQGDHYLIIAEKMGKSPKAIDNALQRIRAKVRALRERS